MTANILEVIYNAMRMGIGKVAIFAYVLLEVYTYLALRLLLTVQPLPQNIKLVLHRHVMSILTVVSVHASDYI